MKKPSQAQLDTTAQEQRSAPRQRSFLQGRVFFNSRRSSIDCIIRDLSDDGARLKFATTPTIPEVFELYVPNKDESYQARIIWHDGSDMGVTLSPFSEVPVGTRSALEERVARLEREVAALKRRLEEPSGI
jgi:hypothetical protein